MKFYDYEVVNKAKLLRKKGYSLRKIGEEINVPSATLSRWLRNIEVNNPFYKKARLVEKKCKEKYKKLVEKYRIDKHKALILLSLLYWCEGSKYPSTGNISFSNSDYLMINMFVNLLRKSFDISESKLRVHLQLHTTHDIDKEKKFWSKILNIPLSQFQKPTVTRQTRIMKRTDYRGTCTIKYYDVKLLLQITGIYELLALKI